MSQYNLQVRDDDNKSLMINFETDAEYLIRKKRLKPLWKNSFQQINFQSNYFHAFFSLSPFVVGELLKIYSLSAEP